MDANSIGKDALYLKVLKSLDSGTVGKIYSVNNGYAVIHYPQNLGTNKVVYHSANFEDIQLTP